MDVAVVDTEITEPDHDLRSGLHQEFIDLFRDVRSSTELEAHPQFHPFKDLMGQALRTPEVFTPNEVIGRQPRDFIRVVCWNLERGTQLSAIVDMLKNHPWLSDHDLVLITEIDHGMARSGNRHLTRDLADALGLHAVFGPSHLNFDLGNGPESKRAQGRNTVALQGHALLSRFPIEQPELVPLPEPKDLMRNRGEKQYGQERAIVATVNTSLGPLHIAVGHLSARSSRRQRVEQITRILQALNQRPGPAIIGGDWNTHTYNTHNLPSMMLGGLHRYVSGIEKTLARYYPEPNRYFERKLFQTLQEYNFSYEEFNVLGATTTHYNFTDPERIIHLQDWIPRWCMPPFLKTLKAFGGAASLKLDWIAGRDVKGSNPRVVFDLPKGPMRISDHDPIMVDVQPATTGHA